MLTEMLLEKNLIPDVMIRFEIRRLLRQRLRELKNSDENAFIETLSKAPIALSVEAANEQHYEVPAGFFEKVLGPKMKYSCAFFKSESDTLEMAEENMLALTCQRAELTNGQNVLELGCGWGSLTLWMAERYPDSKIVGVSNSSSQREFILKRAQEKGLKNIEILTQDMNHFNTDREFDRVVSVEMFEHMRNVPLLLQKISKWLMPDGKLFVHIFAHKDSSYLFEDRDESDWMSRYFFTGGMMPSHSLYRQFNQHLEIEQEWVIPGVHYARTAEHWLSNMDKNEKSIQIILNSIYGQESSSLWRARWRVFFMACAELWGWKPSAQWQVSHYRFRNKRNVTK